MARVLSKLRQGQQWLKTKLKWQQRSASLGQAPASEERGVNIGAPTDFRRADVTLGTDCEGRPVLVEQAREDAQAIFNASKKTDSSEKEVVS
ncbi:hypothetical protein LTR64_003462 [Lithohypha guttulata]|uniref:uncharacterized protein n=1 Tax=Lithohypha guttulata TaxID=1690604 RepID=UPI002DE12F1B|nr:hypothetical protein LTR51_000319 [Lithohypha guttulata]